MILRRREGRIAYHPRVADDGRFAMRRTLLAALLCLSACSSNPGTPDAGEGDGGGDDGGTTAQDRYDFYGFTGGQGLDEIAMAVAPDGRIGVAYFVDMGVPQGGTVADFELRYQEWNAGQISMPEVVTTVQRVFGLDLAFQPSGQPAVTYLGGDGETGVTGPSVFWLQSDAVVTRRSANGTWTEEVVVRFSNEAPAGNPVSDTGYLVGMYAALSFDGSTTFLAYRDAHVGQNQQDSWAGADVEMAVGSEMNWQRTMVLAGGVDKQGYGGHIQMVIAGGQPAIVFDQILGAPGAISQNVHFMRRKADGTWMTRTRPFGKDIGNTQKGPSITYDPVLGFAVAVVDRSEDALYFARSVNDGVTWSEATPVYQSGSGGWYPSVSVNPVTHDPSIAFYICSRTAGMAEGQGSCPENEDKLVISERIGNIWREHTVDEAGGWTPKLAHLADGRRVIAYRDPLSGAVKLAVEK